MLSKSSSAETEKLCGLILEVAGRDTNRLPSVRRHVRVLDTALEYMNPVQAKVARERIKRFETKWGPQLVGKAKSGQFVEEIAPEQRVARWLSMRRVPERNLYVAHRAAVSVWNGETALGRIMDYAYASETDRVIHPVGYDSFSEMLFQLRIAVRPENSIYRPGTLCRWWVEEMEPSKAQGTAYAACLQLLQEICRNRRLVAKIE